MGHWGMAYTLGSKVYRRTIKRSRFCHAVLYNGMQSFVVPLIEKIVGFHTLPDDPLWFRLEMLTRTYEVATVKVVEKHVSPGMVVLDVGAHTGYYSRIFSRLVGKSGHIIAFEPNPVTFEVLRRNMKSLPNVMPVQAAVSERDGEAVLYDALYESGGASLRLDKSKRQWEHEQLSESEIIPRNRDSFTGNSYSVKTVSVDSYLQTLGIQHVDFVKMDIEGAEMAALEGMQQTIAASPNLTLVMEFNPQALSSFNIVPELVMKRLCQLGFTQIFAIEEKGAVTEITDVSALVATMLEQMSRVNLLCLKESEA